MACEACDIDGPTTVRGSMALLAFRVLVAVHSKVRLVSSRGLRELHLMRERGMASGTITADTDIAISIVRPVAEFTLLCVEGAWLEIEAVPVCCRPKRDDMRGRRVAGETGDPAASSTVCTAVARCARGGVPLRLLKGCAVSCPMPGRVEPHALMNNRSRSDRVRKRIFELRAAVHEQGGSEKKWKCDMLVFFHNLNSRRILT
jgi:hypothetical protein